MRVEVGPLVPVAEVVATVSLQSVGGQLEALLLAVQVVVLQHVVLELQVVLVARHFLTQEDHLVHVELHPEPQVDQSFALAVSALWR